MGKLCFSEAEAETLDQDFINNAQSTDLSHSSGAVPWYLHNFSQFSVYGITAIRGICLSCLFPACIDSL